MTPEERNRTIEFIIQSQARLAAAQEQDREERAAFEKWSKGLHQRVVELIHLQSRRLDDNERERRAAQKRHDELLQELRDRLDRIFDKLPDRPDRNPE